MEVVKILNDYTSTAKAAPADAQTLLTEVASLSQVLQQLRDFLRKPDHNINFRETSVLCSVVAICDVKVKTLHSALDKFRSGGAKRDRMKWPFQKQECLDTVRTLHHCAQTIQLSLTISNGYWNYSYFTLTISEITNLTNYFRALLSRTSQEFTVALTDRKEQHNEVIRLLKVIPPEVQELRAQINEVQQSIPILDSLASELVLHLQRHDSGSFSLPQNKHIDSYDL